MITHICQLSKDEIASLKAALMSCRDWQQQNDLLIGYYDGWRIHIGETTDLTAVCCVTNSDFHVQLDFPSDIARIWLDRIRSRQ